MMRIRKMVGKAIGAIAVLLCFGTATALADSINLSEVTANTTVADGKTLTGTLGANVKISIADGATVTLDGVAINGANDEDYSWAGITCEGGGTIILKGANTVKGFYENYPGIYVPEGKTLTIKGDGSLDASSNGYGAGIGGGYNISCGNIVIEGGTIVATGGYLATGIGSGAGGSCGTVTIGGTVYADGITQSPYTYPTYTATLKDGTEDAANWTITPSEGLAESNTVTVAYAGENKVKSVKAVAIPLTLSVATAEDVGKVVCADGHLHDAKTAVPDGCTAVGIIGKVTEKGHGLILALQNASSQNWNTINGWTSTTGYAGTTLKVLPDDAARGANLTSYTTLGDTPVSDWAVAQKSDYEAIFINLGSTTVNSGTIYDGNVNAYITTGVGGTAISGDYWSATAIWGNYVWGFSSDYWHSYVKAYTYNVRPVLGFEGEATAEIAVTPVDGKPNEWTFQMPAGDVEVEVAYLAVATFEVEGETYAVITNVVGEAVETPSADPVKAGHSFAGWFTEATGGTQITDETLMGIADTTFYAQFREPILTIENGVLTAVDFNGCTDIDLVIPTNVTTIGDSVFYQCTGLASVTIPGSVKTISHAAFRDCTGLTSVTIEEGVTTIGERAFARCVNLASITIPGTVTEIGEAAFSDCKSLTSLTIPGSVKTIGPQAFQNCTGLESVTLEEGVETIGRVAFDGCENLSSVTIPDSVKEIGNNAFAGCNDALYEEGTGNLSGVKLVDGWAVGYDAGSISENLDLTGVRGIAGGAFAGCDVITGVIIPDGVATIPEYAFNGCDNLTGVTIPDSVTSIGEGAFGGCDNLASVTIPDSVTSIGKDAFEGCSEDLYDTTTIPGVALVDGWAVGYTDALPENLDLTGTRGIASMAFRDSTLESVTIPGNVARVPAGAFMSCSSLASVTLEEGVTAIDDSAFIECSALESVEIPDTVTAIGPQAFVSCAKLASVTVPGSVAEIGPAAFGMCSSLTNITIEAGVTNIGMMAFAMCSALESVEIPDTATAIGSQAFLMSMNLASVTIPSSVMEIGKDAFLYTALSTVNVDYGDGDRVKALLAASGVDVSKLTFVEPFMLTFDPAGGEFAEGVETNRFIHAGAELGELPEATLTGYTFKGWFTAATNGYEVAATNTMGDADATVYAQWTINQYTITFAVDGATYAVVTNDYGAAVTAPEAPAKTGYTFAGWDPELPETMPAEDLSFTAQWTANRYTLTFDSNGGSDVAAITGSCGADVKTPAAPTKTGYTFTGWEPEVPKTIPASNLTHVAQWRVNSYSVAFDSNGGDAGEMDAASWTYGAETNLAVCAFTRTGYTFAGWATEADGDVVYNDAASVSNLTDVADGSVTLYAQWTANAYAIAFDANGGEGEMDGVACTYDTPVRLPACTFGMTGHAFAGWATNAAADAVYADGASVSNLTEVAGGAVTLHAQWKINRYTVTFVVEGETYAAITNDYGSEVTAPADPDRGSAYRFIGWDKDVPATVPAENVTLTALWKTMKIDVPSIINGDTNATVNVTVGEVYTDAVIEQITKEAQAAATRHGQAVAGWVNRDGSEVTGATVVSTNDVLSAVWETVNPLVPETRGEGTVDASKAQKFEAYILDAEGATRGTAVVMVGRMSKSTGLSSVKAQVKLVGENKTYTFKATEAKGGKAKLSTEKATEGVELYNKNLGTMVLDIGSEGVSGSLGEYEINGSRNVYKTDKAAYATWAGTWTAAIAAADGGAWSAFSIKVKKSGSVTVKGVTADGAKFSATTRLMVADDGSEACVAVKGTKKAPVGFTLWLGLDADGAACAEGVESASGDAVAGEAAVAGKAAVAGAETWTLSAGGEAIATLGWNGSRFSSGKTASAKVTYAKSTGLISGSYKTVAAAADGKTKKTTVKFSGVFVDGIGYGVTTKGAASAPVALVPTSAQ
ncbi:MAG: leucine-rich repeat protein [Kiritimatiellae bacterium]|nr:leucine-rich repeat protein [Kiritimatiellia bacterium]